MYGYSVYGLSLAVSHPIAWLEGLEHGGAADLTVVVGEAPPGCGSGECELAADAVTRLNPDGTLHYRFGKISGGPLLRLDYADGHSFVMDEGGTRVWVTWPQSSTREDGLSYLMGPILGLLLRLRGVCCLHASGVEVDGKAVLLVGDSGAGKSTSAAAFATLGYPVICDDIAPLRSGGGAVTVDLGYPRIRLWPATVEALFGAPDALPAIAPRWAKRYMRLPTARRTHATPLPLAAAYFLEPRSPAGSVPCIADLPAKTALLRLIANSYGGSLLSPQHRANEFLQFASLPGRVGLCRVTPADSVAGLASLCEAIAGDVRRRWCR